MSSRKLSSLQSQPIRTKRHETSYFYGLYYVSSIRCRLVYDLCAYSFLSLISSSISSIAHPRTNQLNFPGKLWLLLNWFIYKLNVSLILSSCIHKFSCFFVHSFIRLFVPSFLSMHPLFLTSFHLFFISSFNSFNTSVTES